MCATAGRAPSSSAASPPRPSSSRATGSACAPSVRALDRVRRRDRPARVRHLRRTRRRRDHPAAPDRSRTPAIVVLHTVLAAPTPHQRAVLDTVCKLAADRRRHDRQRARHPAQDVQRRATPRSASSRTVSRCRIAASRRRRTSDRGASSRGDSSRPGKGLEWGIRAIAQLRDVVPPVEYVIAGQTHPKVLAHEGERYRESLQQLIAELDLDDVVTLDDRYLDADAARRPRRGRPTSCCCPTTRAIRPRPASWSRRSPRASRRRHRLPARGRAARRRRRA